MTLTVCQRLREHLATVYGVTPRGLPVDDWVQRLLTAARLDADQSPLRRTEISGMSAMLP